MSDPTETIPGPEPTQAVPTPAGPAGADPGAWVAGPPPPPPGRDPAIPVVETPPAAAGARPAGARPGAARLGQAALTHLRGEPVWSLAAAAVLVAYVAAWLDAVLAAVRHQPGLTAQQRLLDLFGPGSVEWGLLLLLALGFMAAGRQLPASRGGPVTGLVPTALLVAAGTVAAAAALGFVVELANFGHGIDAAFSGIVARLAALAASGVALWWAWRAREGAAP